MISRQSRDKKFRIIDIEKMREAGRRRRYLSYYLKPVSNGRNSLAKNIDFYVFIAAALLIIYLIAAAFTASPLRGLFFAAPIAVSALYLAFRVKNILERDVIAHRRLWRAGRLCQESIKNLGNADKLQALVFEILEKLPGFSDVHLLREPAEIEGRPYMTMGLRALHLGMPVAVGCVIPDSSAEAISYESVRLFAEEIKRLNIEEGILVAAGSFSNEAGRAAREGKKRLALVDLYRLMDLARVTGHSIFPTSQLQEAGSAPVGWKGIYGKLFRYAFTREKARGYFLSSVIMLTLFFSVAAEGVPRALYILFGMVNLAMSLYCLFSNREADILGSAGEKTAT